MNYISNAFSLQMVIPSNYYLLVEEVTKLPEEGISCIGHADTARVLGLPYNRQPITLEFGDTLYVAQLVGGRLPEGCKTLPAGYTFRFYRIKILPSNFEELIVSGMPY